MPYAENTEVPVEKTRGEIESLVRKAGAKKFSGSWDEKEALIVFFTNDRIVRFRLPTPTDADALKSPTGRSRNIERTRQRWLEKENRRRWRALLLCIRAKLESVESGIETFDEAFLSQIVTEDRRTIYERIFDTKNGLKLLPPSSGESIT